MNDDDGNKDDNASDRNDAQASGDPASTSSLYSSTQIIATADLPVAQPLAEEEAARQDAEMEQEIQHLLELERNVLRVNVQVHPVEEQSPSREDPQLEYVVSPANNDRSYRRVLLFSCLLVLAAVAVVAVITVMIMTSKQTL